MQRGGCKLQLFLGFDAGSFIDGLVMKQEKSMEALASQPCLNSACHADCEEGPGRAA
jgi:hypothetical protein